MNWAMKLIIQIPCYNEEKTLLSVLEELPTEIK
jgi:glycosyltransferase involved in cell wall biosynthesis